MRCFAGRLGSACGVFGQSTGVSAVIACGLLVVTTLLLETEERSLTADAH
jgi:hypothetical protein